MFRTTYMNNIFIKKLRGMRWNIFVSYCRLDRWKLKRLGRRVALLPGKKVTRQKFSSLPWARNFTGPGLVICHRATTYKCAIAFVEKLAKRRHPLPAYERALKKKKIEPEELKGWLIRFFGDPVEILLARLPALLRPSDKGKSDGSRGELDEGSNAFPPSIRRRAKYSGQWVSFFSSHSVPGCCSSRKFSKFSHSSLKDGVFAMKNSLRRGGNEESMAMDKIALV